MDWWALFNASLIVQICLVIHEILANKDFIVTNNLISQLFVFAFVYSAYVQIALIWGLTAQLSLWKSVHWLWRYKLNEVCDNWHFSFFIFIFLDLIFLFFWFYFDNEEVHDWSHMTCHIMWGHRPRLWKKELKEWCQSIYIRIKLFIVSINHEDFV